MATNTDAAIPVKTLVACQRLRYDISRGRPAYLSQGEAPFRIILIEGTFAMVRRQQATQSSATVTLRRPDEDDSIKYGNSADWRTNSQSALPGYIYRICNHEDYRTCGCFKHELRWMVHYDILKVGGYNYLDNTPQCSSCDGRMFFVRTAEVAEAFADKAASVHPLILRNRPDLVCLDSKCPVVTRQYVCRQKDATNSKWNAVAGSFRPFPFAFHRIMIGRISAPNSDEIFSEFLGQMAAAVSSIPRIPQASGSQARTSK